MDFDYDDVHIKNKCVDSNLFIFSRVSVPRAKALTNTSDKLNWSTTTSNRFKLLQNSKVSHCFSPTAVGGNNNTGSLH